MSRIRSARESGGRARQRGGETERREVRSADPSLSPEANRLLTEELQDAVGADHVEVPAGAPDRTREHHASAGAGMTSNLAQTRLYLVIAFFVLLTVGVVVSLATGSWWALVGALVVHAVGTLATLASVVQLTTQVEHVESTTAARLEEEGVNDPDKVLTDLVEDYAAMRDASGTAEVFATGNNDNTADPLDDPARATAEQRTSITPDGRQSKPGGSGSVIGGMPLAVVLGLVVLTLIVGIVEGGELWALPAMVWLGAAVWLATMLHMDGRREERAARDGERIGSDREAGDSRGSATRLLPLAAAIVVGVIGFGVMMVLLATS